jgi:hypothetical protein
MRSNVNRVLRVGSLLAISFGISACQVERGAAGNPRPDFMGRFAHLSTDLGYATSVYFTSVGRWPSSLAELRALKPEQMVPKKRKTFESCMNEIVLEGQKVEMTLSKKEDGSLVIFLSVFDSPSEGMSGTIALSNSIVKQYP